MAAIYSGIHLKLKSPQTPWEDRLKLARFAWISSQCLLPNKEQVLLDWCTHALTVWHNKKVKFSQDVLEGLWCYLDEVVHSRKLHSLVKEGKTVTLRLNMAQLLLDHLQDCTQGRPPVPLSTILSVCRGILSSPALSSVFTIKYELMVNLLTKFCLLACHEIQKQSPPERQKDAKAEDLQAEPATDLEIVAESKKEQPSANLFEGLLQVLTCYLSVQREQANPNRVFSLVTNQLFQPLVLLRYLLTSQDSVAYTHSLIRQPLRRDVRIKVDSILQLALFPPELLSSYKAELFPPKEDSGKRGSGGTKGPLKPVGALLSNLNGQDYCELSLRYPVKSDTSSLMFRFFLESYGKGKEESEEEQRMLCFYLLARLVPVLDLQVDGGSVSHEQKSPPASSGSPQSWGQALQSLESLLNQALAADIYNIAADRIRHGEVQLMFYRTVGKTLLTEAQPSIPSWYRCLKVLLNLNHLILEPDLERLLSSAWVDAENMEAQVQRARQLMVCSLLQTYTKLHQLPHLFSSLLSVICQPALDERRPPLLSEGVSASLRTCLLDSSPSQVLEICSLVLQNIRTRLLPDLANEERDGEATEMDGRRQNKEAASLKLSRLCQLLHAVLFNLKTLDNSSPVLLVRQSKSFMEEMQQTIKDLLHLSSKPNLTSVKRTPKKGRKKALKASLWEEKTQEATLLLRYTWVEVDVLFHIHCSKYTSLDSFPTAAEDESEASPLLTHVERVMSGAILPAHLRPSPSCSPMSCLLLKLLTLQQMKKVLLDNALLAEGNAAALLTRAVQSIVAKTEGRPAGEQAWDGQLGSVDASTYPAAHWYVVVSNLPLIVPHLSEEDVSHIARVLVASLMHGDVERAKDQPPGSLSFSSISSQLALSKVFPELPSLFSATVRAIARRIVGVLGAGRSPKARPSFLALYEKEAASVPSEVDVCRPVFSPLIVEAIVEDISASSKAGEAFVLLTHTQTKELLNSIQILTDLNPDGMNAQDLSSTFLLLLFVFTSTQPEPTAAEPLESGGDAVLLGKLLGALTRLLDGNNFQSVLKVIHGGTLLQTTLSSLLWHSGCRKPAATTGSDWLDLVGAAQAFIRSLVQMIITRNSSVRLNLDQFASYLTSKEMVSRQNEQPGSAASMLSVHLLLASLTSFSQAIMSNMGRSKVMDETLTEILRRTTSLLGPTVESALKPQWDFSEAVTQPASALGQAFIVEVVTVMLQCELASLSAVPENRQISPTHVNLYQAIYQQILREMSSAPRPIDFLVCSLRFLSAFYKAMEKMGEELYLQIMQSLNRLLKAPWLSSTDAGKLEPAVKELLLHLVEKNTTDQFNVLLLMIREGLDVRKLGSGNWKEALSAVVTVKLLSSCQLPEACSKALWLIAPQIISAMVFLVRTSSQDLSLTLPFTVPTVTSLTSLLRQGEGLLSNPQHVVQVLGALQSLPLDHLSPTVYQSAFLAVHEALFAIIKCHPQVISKAAPSFLNVFYRLVASVMQEGRQKGDSDAGADCDVYLQCSRLTERMYSHIAATPQSFTALPAFMVAQYVTELQKVTLRPDVKLHLTEGIYCILDLCMEQDIKFLRAGLHAGVREVFNELHSNYIHYHKTQRQGEDKYTV